MYTGSGKYRRFEAEAKIIPYHILYVSAIPQSPTESLSRYFPNMYIYI